MISKNTTDLEYRRLVRASKTLDSAALPQETRVAVLSDGASQQFVPCLKRLFYENGVRAQLFEGAFDAIELETLNADSELYRFRPDFVVLANCTQALRSRYYEHAGADFVDSATERLMTIWDALRRNSTSRVIQFTYAMPYEREFGNYSLKVTHSLYASVRALNVNIARHASQRGNLLICDVEAIASWVGHRQWYDDRLWNLSKAFCHLEYLPLVAQSIVEQALAAMGRVVKCVILDLDNTLWGGIVGDDGPLGIAIGAHGDGEPFYHFQKYLLSLKKRGILLAVCSKNDRANAIQPFVENPGMVLKLDDIALFIANWENKADNIRRIQTTLDIGFDSMVCLDDNPFERSLVREFLPEVIVPELPEDPADYVRTLSELNLFETTSFSAEDAARSGLYQQEADRRALQATFSNIDDYLESLAMKITVARFAQGAIARIAQLIQRSNQFNLTTHRYSEAECEQMMGDCQQCIPLSASLRDRLGDHGLISVVILRLLPDELLITDWLMSCRVLARGVEQFLMTRVMEMARSQGFCKVTGEYIPTAKNGMVKEFFGQFGFVKVSEEKGRSKWSIDPAAYQPCNTYISESE